MYSYHFILKKEKKNTEDYKITNIHYHFALKLLPLWPAHQEVKFMQLSLYIINFFLEIIKLLMFIITLHYKRKFSYYFIINY